jgi:hypothetical protein
MAATPVSSAAALQISPSPLEGEGAGGVRATPSPLEGEGAGG